MTTALTVSRKQRLQTLEKQICKAAEQIQKNGLEIGRDLCEIRDENLWSEEGFATWNEYLKRRAGELVGKSFAHAKKLISAAEVYTRLPRVGSSMSLAPTHLQEIGRLAPDIGKPTGGTEKDYSRLRKKDVEKVLKAATANAGNSAPTVKDVRKAVDAELGIDRTAKAAETNEKRNAGVELAEYLRQSKGRIEGITVNLTKVPAESWTLLGESHPKLATSVAEACDVLAELLRS